MMKNSTPESSTKEKRVDHSKRDEERGNASYE
jgi:hypothetical protein